MDKKRLAILARRLDNVKRKEFDMGYWGKRKQEWDDPACGTAACALGQAGCIPSFNRDGLLTVFNENGGDVVYTNDEGFNYAAFNAGREFFALTDEQSDYLFDPAYYGKRKDPKYVANRIRRMMAEDDIPSRDKRKFGFVNE